MINSEFSALKALSFQLFVNFNATEGKGWILQKLNINFRSKKPICRGAFCSCGPEGRSGDENRAKRHAGRYRRIRRWRLKSIHQERTMSYVNGQNLAVRTSELTPRQMLHATLLYLITWTSARPSNQMHPLPGHFTSNQRNSGQVDISAPSNRTITNHKSTSVNPNATPFVPRTLASKLVNEPTQGQDENRGTTSELIQFLLK